MLMAHNIEERDGVASFVENVRNEMAWHKLGEHCDGMLTAKEALEKSRANFEVTLQPIATLSGEVMSLIESGQPVPPELLKKLINKERMATMRTDLNKTLGIVGKSYGVVQNADAFKFVDFITNGSITDTKATIECAGVLGNGERIFITAKFGDEIRLGEGDAVRMYCVFTTSHDGTGAVQCMVTPVRVVCNNTLNLALSHNSGKFSIRHTRYVGDRLFDIGMSNAKEVFGKYVSYKDEFINDMKRLTNIRLNARQIEDVLGKAFLKEEYYNLFVDNSYSIDHPDIPKQSQKLMESLHESLESGVGQNYESGVAHGTGLWLLNGITTYFQNGCKYKSDADKFDKITNGTALQRVQKVHDLILAY